MENVEASIGRQETNIVPKETRVVVQDQLGNALMPIGGYIYLASISSRSVSERNAALQKVQQGIDVFIDRLDEIAARLDSDLPDRLASGGFVTRENLVDLKDIANHLIEKIQNGTVNEADFDQLREGYSRVASTDSPEQITAAVESERETLRSNRY